MERVHHRLVEVWRGHVVQHVRADAVLELEVRPLGQLASLDPDPLVVRLQSGPRAQRWIVAHLDAKRRRRRKLGEDPLDRLNDELPLARASALDPDLHEARV